MTDLLNETDAAVVKRGETCIITTFSRTALGLGVRVKTIPAVELFMRGLAVPDAPPLDVSVMDRYWSPLAKATQPLLAYRISPPFPSCNGPNGPIFTLERLGRPLINDTDEEGGGFRGGYSPVNLSYLRLIGISEGAGISFNLKGVYSLEALRQLQERIAQAQIEFYTNYIRPVNLSVIVSTQEIQL